MLNVVKAVKEGIVIEGVEGKRGMTIPASLANLIAQNYAAVVGNDPIVQGIKYQATLGKPHPLDMIFGKTPEKMPVEFRVYPLGLLEIGGESIEMDIYLAETEEGLSLLAWCPKSEREIVLEAAASGDEDRGMAVLGYAGEDHAELLELLGQDFSVLEPDAA